MSNSAEITREAGNLLVGESFYDNSVDMWLIVTKINLGDALDVVIFRTPVGDREFRFSDKLCVGVI